MSRNLTIKMLASHEPDFTEVTAIMRGLHELPDRDIVIVAASVLDLLLRYLLVSKFVELKPQDDEEIFGTGGNALLGSFGAKITLCKALGLLTDDSVRVVRGIQKIRNLYAHSLANLDLANEPVANLIRSLPIPDADAERALSKVDAGVFETTDPALLGELAGYHGPNGWIPTKGNHMLLDAGNRVITSIQNHDLDGDYGTKDKLIGVIRLTYFHLLTRCAPVYDKAMAVRRTLL